MLDRVYVVALFVLVFLFQRDLIYLGVPLLVLLALLAAFPLFLFEGLANFLSPKLQRDLITFRYKPKRAIPKLVRHLGLDRPQTADALADKAKALARAAQAVTMRHPNPIYGPLRPGQLDRALDPALHPGNTAFGAELVRAWLGPKPGPTLGGLLLKLRAATGSLLFGGWIDTARSKSLSGAASVIASRTTPAADHPWQTADFPGSVTFLAWKRLAEAQGFSAFDADPAWLPLSDQRQLAAITAQLFGTPTQALLARVMNPSMFGALRKLASDRKKWQIWTAGQQTTDEEARAAADERKRYRAGGSLTAEEITGLVAATAQDSILLSRLWPPGESATSNSWLGGLPCLPSDMDWPRSGETGLPLHFLAQVDCADLPTLGGTSPLPRDGLLLFFSDLDEERVSDEGIDTTNAVVHVPKARQSVPPRDLPEDLPEIDHSAGKPTNRSDGRRSYAKWPVQPVAVKIWGDDAKGDPRTANHDYIAASIAAHDASLAAVMPPPAQATPAPRLFSTSQRKDAEGKPLKDAAGYYLIDASFHPEALPAGFPWCGAGVDIFLDRLLQAALGAARDADQAERFIDYDAPWRKTEAPDARDKRVAEAKRKADHAAAVARLEDSARDVLTPVPRLGTVSSATTDALMAWLGRLARDRAALVGLVERAVSDTTLALAQEAVTDPGLFRLLPDSIFAHHAKRLTPAPRQSQHLMLGPAQRKTNETAGSGVRLLCLDSDYGPGMMFCDCGVIEYWIKPEDLAARRFDRAYALTAGS